MLMVPRISLPSIFFFPFRACQKYRLIEGFSFGVIDLHVDAEWSLRARQDRGLMLLFCGLGFELSEELEVDVQ